MPWFSAPTRLNQTLEGEEIKLAKYHEVVIMAIAEAISDSPWRFTHTAYVHFDNSGCSLAKNTKWVNKEMKGWGMEGRPVLLPFVEGGDKEVWRTDIDALCNGWKSISVSLAKLSAACWLIRRHASALTELPFMRNFSESEQDRWASMAPRRLLNVSRIQFIQTFIEFSIPTRATHAHRVPLATRSCKGVFHASCLSSHTPID